MRFGGQDGERERELKHEKTEEASDLPESYYLDESDPDILVLRRQDGTFVAAFSAQGASTEGIVEAAREDYYALLPTRVPKKGKRASGEGEGPDTTGAAVRDEPGLDRA